jgi:PAS domain-containing protein
MDEALMANILDSLKDPLVFADTDHKILYMNKAAVAHYEEGIALLGRSLLDCHNERSRSLIAAILEEMRDGLDERLITDDEKHRIYMRAVRSPEGVLLGYYERYEPPVKKSGSAG